MGNIVSGTALAVLLASSLVASDRAPAANAQQAPATVSCAAAPPASPMPGHYTGPWHSQGIYHFIALGHDIQLTVTIDGTIDATIAPDGSMSGTATGKVDAPVTHDGQRDVSSGYGSITGAIQGQFNSTGSVVILPHPSILMHWGTFVGGGYTADRTIVMPDYTLNVGTAGCVGADGAVAEQGFPVQNIVDDANGTIAQVPGEGSATGSWSLTSDATATFTTLSAQVNAFIDTANGILGNQSVPLTAATLNQQIISPLRVLATSIASNPQVARCLLERLGAWEAGASATLQSRAAAMPLIDLPSLRLAGDLERGAQAVAITCVPVASATMAPVLSATQGFIDRAVQTAGWVDLALAAREYLLDGGDAASLHARIATDLQALDSGPALDRARIAYVFGDDSLSQLLIAGAADGSSLNPLTSQHPLPLGTQRSSVAAGPALRPLSRQYHASHKVKHKRKHRKRIVIHSAVPPAAATPVPPPAPAPTSPPQTLRQRLAAGVAEMQFTGNGGSVQWTPVASATHYLVTVASPDGAQFDWSWAGSGTTARYGDTELPGIAGTSNDGPVAAPPAGASWSILALDSQNRVVGIALRVSP